MDSPQATTDLLAGIRIIEAGRCDTVHIAGMLLADQGADIIRIESAETDEFDTAFHGITDRAKRSVRVPAYSSKQHEIFRRLVSRADVIIEDADRTLVERYGLTPDSVAPLIRCTVCPTDAPEDDTRWTEETVSAQTGLYESGIGFGSPRFYDLPLTSVLGALYAVNAVTRALIARKRFGSIDTVRIPLDRIIMFSQSLTIMIRSKTSVLWDPFRWIASPFMGVWRTAEDGYIYLHIGMPRHMRSFMFFLGKAGYTREKESIKQYLHPASRRDPIMMQSTEEAIGITAVLQKLFLKKTAGEWERTLGEAGFCCTKMRSFDEWFSHPQVVSTGQLRTCTSADGEEFSVPGPLFRSSGHLSGCPVTSCSELPVEQFSELWPQRAVTPEENGNGYPLTGIRVLDMSRVIAGPFTGRLLAEAGAEVLQLSLRKSQLSWEEPFGLIYNPGKSSVAVDYTRPGGKEAFKKILAQFRPDIVIHNFMDEAAEKIGCDHKSCMKINPDIICLDIRGYEKGGPWAEFPGFEQNVQTASGILATYSIGDIPRMLPLPFNDLCAGLIASFGALCSLIGKKKQHPSGNHITSYLTTPSILVSLHQLSKKGKTERAEHFNHFFKASDAWFLLSAKRSSLGKVAAAAVPQLSRFLKSDNTIDEKFLTPVFKKKPVKWWIRQFREAGISDDIIITRRRILSKVLEMELSKKESLFSYQTHEGFGEVICARPPLTSKKCQVTQLTPAPFLGSSTEKYLDAAGIDPAPHTTTVPSSPPKTPSLLRWFRRLRWVIRQSRWLGVIVFKNRGLRPEETV